MGLAHAVVTCVARDDLADGGAGGFAATIAAIRRRSPRTAVEVLISDCKGDERSLRTHLRRPSRRAQPQHRDGGPPAAGRATVGRLRPQPRASWPGPRRPGSPPSRASSWGWGSRSTRSLSTLADLRAVGVDIVTVGPVSAARAAGTCRWPGAGRPRSSSRCGVAGMAMGFAHVQASPLTRSSYHARQAAEASSPVGAAR